MQIKTFISFFAALVFLQTQAQAAIGAVSTATGGSGRGAVEPVDGVFLNPAMISDLSKKNFSFNYSAEQWGLAIVDNGADSYFPAALTMVRTDTSNLDTQQVALSLATTRWKRVSLGVTASMYEYVELGTGNIEQKYRQGVFDAGLTLAITPNFGFGIVGKKINSGKINLAENLQTQRTTAAGISYTYQKFARFRLDVETAPDNKTDRLVYMTGLENYVNDWLVFRLGYQNNNVIDKDFITAGAGFAGPQFGLHYAFISNTSTKSEDKHLIDLTVPF